MNKSVIFDYKQSLKLVRSDKMKTSFHFAPRYQLYQSILRGVSQVMLQNNPITGLLFFMGIFYNSWLMGVGALLGVLGGTLTGLILKFSRKDIADGLYGFNGVLVGIALLLFFKPSFIIFLLIILGSIASSLIMNFMHERKLSPYTFPFVLATWLLILFIKLANIAPLQNSGSVFNFKPDILSSVSMGFGQVMFQTSIITGMFFFIGILINSRINAAYGLLGSLIGFLIGTAFSIPINMINLGVLGYNGVLCGIAFAGKKISGLIYAILSILLSIIILFGFNILGLPAFTAPFVFAVWITLGLKRISILRDTIS